MANPVIKIPTPCRENWQDMAPVNSGRFCATCRKHVRDFSLSTDSEIAKAYRENENMCGRFLTSQLNRELIIPKEKSNYWAAAGAALISFLGLGTQELTAQETPKTEQHQAEVNTLSQYDTKVNNTVSNISGNVSSESDNLNLPGIRVKNLRLPDTCQVTDLEGNFTIPAQPGDTLIFSYVGMIDKTVIIETNAQKLNVTMQDILMPDTFVLGYVERPSVFRRIWYKISNVFR